MVNKKLKKCASLFLVMSMAVSILAGCGSKNETEKAQTTLEKQQKRLRQIILQNQHRMSLAR